MQVDWSTRLYNENSYHIRRKKKKTEKTVFGVVEIRLSYWFISLLFDLKFVLSWILIISSLFQVVVCTYCYWVINWLPNKRRTFNETFELKEKERKIILFFVSKFENEKLFAYLKCYKEKGVFELIIICIWYFDAFVHFECDSWKCQANEIH